MEWLGVWALQPAQSYAVSMPRAWAVLIREGFLEE